MLTPNDELNFMGLGIPLYFDFDVFTIISMAVVFAILSIYLIMRNYSGNNCDLNTGILLF